MRKGESFNSDNALDKIAHELRAVESIGAFLSLAKGNQIYEPKSEDTIFERQTVTLSKASKEQYKRILNHMRIVSVDSFRLIPQFELRDVHGGYLNDRLIFLMDLLEMVRETVK